MKNDTKGAASQRKFAFSLRSLFLMPICLTVLCLVFASLTRGCVSLEQVISVDALMPRSQVLQILGGPIEIENSSDDKIIWKYHTWKYPSGWAAGKKVIIKFDDNNLVENAWIIQNESEAIAAGEIIAENAR